MQNSEPYSFITLLEERHRRNLSFLSEYPELTAVFDCALLIANSLAVTSVIGPGSRSFAKAQCSLMWQISADYHKQSLTHVISRELDPAFALLRMAIELARDANAIARDDRNLKIWFDRENNPESYRKRFKFDRLSSSACLAFDLYKFCSKFGVHGHMTTNIHAKPTGETFANGAGIMINTDETAIFSGLEIWLRSFFPIHALYIDALKKDILDVEPFKMFADFIQNLDPILEAIGKKARGTDIEH